MPPPVFSGVSNASVAVLALYFCIIVTSSEVKHRRLERHQRRGAQQKVREDSSELNAIQPRGEPGAERCAEHGGTAYYRRRGRVDEAGVRGATVTRIVQVAGRGESDVAAVVEPLVEDDPTVVLAFLAKQQGIQVRLTATGDDPADAHRRAQPAVDRVVAALGDAVSGIDGDDLETTVVRLLAAAGQRVATAESATAGGIAARIARVPGASAVLDGGLIVYRDEAKQRLAGLDPDVLARDGAVSAATTRALALAARERTGADWAIGATAVAGPGTVDELPIGTAFWALAAPDGTCEVHERIIPGDRIAIANRLGSAALDLLRRRLLGGTGLA